MKSEQKKIARTALRRTRRGVQRQNDEPDNKVVRIAPRRTRRGARRQNSEADNNGKHLLAAKDVAVPKLSRQPVTPRQRQCSRNSSSYDVNRNKLRTEHNSGNPPARGQTDFEGEHIQQRKDVVMQKECRESVQLR